MCKSVEERKTRFHEICGQTTFSPAKYINLIKKNRNYRMYVISHMCQHGGDWFVRIAALISVGRLAKGSSTALSMIVLCRTIPEMVISPFGGALADRFDRKMLMVRLDLVAAISVLSYMVAVYWGDVRLLFAATCLRSAIQALYNPVTSSIVPLLVPDAEDLKIAVTINGMIWSGMLLFGGWFAGLTSAKFGVHFCYLFDALTYVISAGFISRLDGEFTVNDNSKRKPGKDATTISTFNYVLQALQTVIRMNSELFRYIWHCGFGLLILVKCTGCLIWGPSDVLNVSFTHVEGSEAESSKRMGILYSFIGLGCLFGPIIVNSTFVHGKKPRTLQLSVIVAQLMMAMGWFGIACNSSSFQMICIFTSVRTLGSAIIWINSTLLLQNLSSPEFLGRMLGLEFALSRVSETAIALITGRLEDTGSSKQYIALMASCIGVISFTLWSVYHLLGLGAANDKWNEANNDKETLISHNGETIA